MVASELSWRVFPRLHVVAALWAAPLFLALLLLTGFSWIVFVCAAVLAVIMLVLCASPVRIAVANDTLTLRYWFYQVEIDTADITDIAPVEKALVGLGYKRSSGYQRSGSTTSFLVGGPYLTVTTASGTDVTFSVRRTFADELLDALGGPRQSTRSIQTDE